ncbi:XkdF-like putative serine protease domain-containing protein [Chelativorans alearense]|uniref:XkdF-like putative serine protease domain-containing protein n=1 Tax=Chelativorans alearense TaxID=2681495 RepID=UPI0013D31D39|nr:XkdF-like putative serine protease domain-containing protein [Chelativorans alearense]
MRTILKRDDDRQRLYGIALIADEVDSQGDVVGDAELEDAAVQAVKRGAIVKIDHEGAGVGRLVASWPLTKEIADAMGVSRPEGKSAWLVGLEIEDPDAWARVKAGEVGHALSIGGRAQRQEF